MGPFGPSVPIFILFSILWSSVNCAHFDLQLVPSLTDGDYQHLYRVAVQCFDGQQNPRGTITGNGVAPMNTNGESGMKFEKIGINFGNGRDCKEFEVQISMVNKDDDKWAIWPQPLQFVTNFVSHRLIFAHYFRLEINPPLFAEGNVRYKMEVSCHPRPAEVEFQAYSLHSTMVAFGSDWHKCHHGLDIGIWATHRGWLQQKNDKPTDVQFRGVFIPNGSTHQILFGTNFQLDINPTIWDSESVYYVKVSCSLHKSVKFNTYTTGTTQVVLNADAEDCPEKDIMAWKIQRKWADKIEQFFAMNQPVFGHASLGITISNGAIYTFEYVEKQTTNFEITFKGLSEEAEEEDAENKERKRRGRGKKKMEKVEKSTENTKKSKGRNAASNSETSMQNVIMLD